MRPERLMRLSWAEWPRAWWASAGRARATTAAAAKATSLLMRLPRGSGPPIFGPAAERRKTGDPGLGARRRLLSYDREHVPAGAVVMKVRPHHLVVAVAAILVAEP